MSMLVDHSNVRNQEDIKMDMPTVTPVQTSSCTWPSVTTITAIATQMELKQMDGVSPCTTQLQSELYSLCGQPAIPTDSNVLIRADITNTIYDEEMIQFHKVQCSSTSIILEENCKDADVTTICDRLLDSEYSDNVVNVLGSQFGGVRINCRLAGVHAKPHPQCEHPTFAEADKREVIPVRRVYKCAVCSHMAESIDKILEHQREIHHKLPPCEGMPIRRDFYKGNCNSCSCSHILGQYNCQNCTFSSDCPFSLEIHMRDTHKTQQIYQCPYCHHEHRFYKAMEKHMFEKHIITEGTSSVKVRDVSPKRDDANRALNFSGNQISNSTCGINLLDMRESQVEMHGTKRKYTISEEPYLCLFCSARFSMTNSLKRHLSCEHIPYYMHEASVSVSGLPIENVRCPTCGEELGRIPLMEGHYISKHPQLYPIFRDASQLNEKGEPNMVVSEQLLENFTSASVRTLDETIYRGDMRYDVTTKNYRSLKLAAFLDADRKFCLRINSQLKCSICGFGMLNKITMIRHLVSHTRCWPYWCRRCKQVFKTRRSAVLHEKMCRTQTRSDTPGTKTDSGVSVNMRELLTQNTEILNLLADHCTFLNKCDPELVKDFYTLSEFWCQKCKYSCLQFLEMITHLMGHCPNLQFGECLKCGEGFIGDTIEKKHKKCDAEIIRKNEGEGTILKLRDKATETALRFTTLVVFELDPGKLERTSWNGEESVISPRVPNNGTNNAQRCSSKTARGREDSGRTDTSLVVMVGQNEEDSYDLESVSGESTSNEVTEIPVLANHTTRNPPPTLGRVVKCRVCDRKFIYSEDFFARSNQYKAVTDMCSQCVQWLMKKGSKMSLVEHNKKIHHPEETLLVSTEDQGDGIMKFRRPGQLFSMMPSKKVQPTPTIMSSNAATKFLKIAPKHLSDDQFTKISPKPTMVVPSITETQVVASTKNVSFPTTSSNYSKQIDKWKHTLCDGYTFVGSPLGPFSKVKRLLDDTNSHCVRDLKSFHAKRGRPTKRVAMKRTGRSNRCLNQGSLTCPQCDDFVGVWPDLLTHYEAIHSNIAVCFKCQDTPTFHLVDYYKHLTKYHPGFEMSDCTTRRSDRNVLMGDLLEQLGKASRVKFGDRVSTTMVDCRLVEVRLSPDGDTSTARFVCLHCQYTYRSSDIFSNHITYHLKIGEFRCLHCCKEASTDEMRQHYKLVHQLKYPHVLPRSRQYNDFKQLVEKILEALYNTDNQQSYLDVGLRIEENMETQKGDNDVHPTLQIKIKQESKDENDETSEMSHAITKKEDISRDEPWNFTFFCPYCSFVNRNIHKCKLHVMVNHSRKRFAVGVELLLSLSEEDAEAITSSVMLSKRRIDDKHKVLVSSQIASIPQGFKLHEIDSLKFQRDYTNAMLSMYNHFSILEIVSVFEEFFPCHLCGLVQASLPALFEHWNRIHCLYYPYKCAFCNVTSKRPITIVSHEKRAHPKFCGHSYVVNQESFDDLFDTLETFLLDWLCKNKVDSYIPDDMKLIVDCSVRCEDISTNPLYGCYFPRVTSPTSSVTSSVTSTRESLRRSLRARQRESV